ncbi:hypothetical protein CDD80_4243 [Ophiocordyceps camponoti-rufipedis]|uniref:Uncharacterized protein n=1 Tax=Ophiocordyceps camponoti-rufipedis TaxID=2004952 RepID=A0A2C5Y418_9HYPO|nr:hypothetical protein CDD80_4243 [Ophiocordyceps camponoti-rufipedis]
MLSPWTSLVLAINLLLWFGSSSATPTDLTSPTIEKRSPPNQEGQILYLICSKPPSKVFWSGVPAVKPLVAGSTWKNYESRDIPRAAFDWRTSIVAHKELEGAIRCGRQYFKQSWETQSRFYIYRIKRGPQDSDTNEFPDDDRVETRWLWDSNRILDATWFSLGKRLIWTTEASDLDPLMDSLLAGKWQQNPNIEMEAQASASSVLRQLALVPAKDLAQEPSLGQKLRGRQMLHEDIRQQMQRAKKQREQQHGLIRQQLQEQQLQEEQHLEPPPSPEPDESLYVYSVGALFPTQCFRSGIPSTFSPSTHHRPHSLFERIPGPGREFSAIAYQTKKEALLGFFRSQPGHYSEKKSLWIYEMLKEDGMVHVSPQEAADREQPPLNRVRTTAMTYVVNRIAFIPKEIRKLATSPETPRLRQAKELMTQSLCGLDTLLKISSQRDAMEAGPSTSAGPSTAGSSSSTDCARRVEQSEDNLQRQTVPTADDTGFEQHPEGVQNWAHDVANAYDESTFQQEADSTTPTETSQFEFELQQYIQANPTEVLKMLEKSLFDSEIPCQGVMREKPESMSRITNLLLEEEVDPEPAPVATKRKTASSLNQRPDIAASEQVGFELAPVPKRLKTASSLNQHPDIAASEQVGFELAPVPKRPKTASSLKPYPDIAGLEQVTSQLAPVAKEPNTASSLNPYTDIAGLEHVTSQLAPVAKKPNTASSLNPYLDIAEFPAVFQPQPQPQPIPHLLPGLTHLPETDPLSQDDTGKMMPSKKVPPALQSRESLEELLKSWDDPEPLSAGLAEDILKDWELPEELRGLPSPLQWKQAAANFRARAGFETGDLLPEDLEVPGGPSRPSPAFRPQLVAADSSTSLNTPEYPRENPFPQPERGAADSKKPVTATEYSPASWDLPDDLPELTASPELEQAAAEGPLENLEDLEGLSSPMSADPLSKGANIDFNSRHVHFLGDDKSRQPADRQTGTSKTSSRGMPIQDRPGKSPSSVDGKSAGFKLPQAGHAKSFKRETEHKIKVFKRETEHKIKVFKRETEHKIKIFKRETEHKIKVFKRETEHKIKVFKRETKHKIKVFKAMLSPAKKKFSFQELEAMSLAKAQEHFQALAKKLKFSTVQVSKALSRLRQDFHIRMPESLKTLASNGMLAMTIGLPFYIADIVQTFNRDSTDLEKAAAVTVIVPIVGCSTRLASEMEKGLTAADTTAITSLSLCYAADALLFTPAFPVGIMLHLISSFTGSMQLLDKWFVQERRDQAWEKHYQEILKQMTSGPWHDKMTDWYSDEMLNISLTVSEARGVLDVLSIAKEQELNQTAAQTKLEASLHNDAIERSFCASLRNTRHQVMKQLPGAEWLKTQAHQLNGQFIDLYRSQAELHHRMTPEKNRFIAPGSPMLWTPPSFQSSLDSKFRALTDPILDHLSYTVLDRVKRDEFASKVRSHTLQIMALPPNCGCPVDIDEIEAAGSEPAPNMSGEDLKKTLLCAASRGYNDILEKLRGWLVDLQATDEQGNTALMLAAQKGYEDTAAYLVAWQDANNLASRGSEKKRESFRIRNQAGETAADIAERNGLDRIVELIRKASWIWHV